MKNFILDRLREKFGDEEEEEQEGFPDMNYQVGNTSGLDVGNIPTPMARRIGSQAQIGGGIMEVQIYNPATFSIDRDQIINVVKQLGLDITLHSDPSMGFSSAYKTRGQQGVGIETVHPYFTNYLDALADFKMAVEQEGEGEEPAFDIGRINPHASTSPLPPLEERMPMDVGLDPFGFQTSELKRSPRRDSGRNIFRNPEFMKRFYKTFILDEVDEPYQIYQLFSRFSKEFRDEHWREAQAVACNQFWKNISEASNIDESEILDEKIAMIQSAVMADQGIGKEWLDILEEDVAEFDEELTVSIGGTQFEVENLDDLSSLPATIGRRLGMDNLRSLAQVRHRIKRLTQDDFETDIDQDFIDELKDNIDEPLEDSLDKLWEGNGDIFLISVDAKTQALSRRLDIQQTQIMELAQDLEDYQEDLEDAAKKLMSGDSDFFEGELAEEKDPEDKYRDMLQALMNNFEQPMWMESNLFYYIMPCWMSVSTYEGDDHDGWRAPEFIWKALVEDKWNEKYDIDLKEPAKDDGYFDALEESTEFRMDVAAAVGACYIWGHFTQMESEFDSGNETWMEFMNRHGIGVNLEAMHGSPQQMLKLWRPKDIAVAAHAINITAREELGDINPELDDCIAKFTIDMEHVASFGADPWGEMENMIETEERIAGYGDYSLGIDPEKPLAKILRQYHLMDPGVEAQQGTYHGPFSRGDKQLYTWLYRLVADGFARNGGEPAAIMYEQGEEKDETIYTAKIAMNMIEVGIEPEEVSVDNIDLDRVENNDFRDEKEALIARFFGLDSTNYSREWAKIEEHAFDPLDGLLEAEQFDYTYSGRAALENDNNPQDYQGEEYR